MGRYFSVNGVLYKYGIITVVTQNDERGTPSEMQSEGVSVPKGHNLYRWHSSRHFGPVTYGLGVVCFQSQKQSGGKSAKSTVKGGCLSSEPAARWC